MSSLEVLFVLDAVNTVAPLAVVFIGLPHGAMDGALAVHFGWMNVRRRPWRSVAYVGLAVVVAWLWSVSPVLSRWPSSPSACTTLDGGFIVHPIGPRHR